MVDTGVLKKYKDYISNTEEEQEYISQDSENDGENVLLFFSFDIVNSSIYKTVNYYGWSIVIDRILHSIRNYIKTKIKSAEVWRVFGDEIIFIVKICDKPALFEHVEIVYDTLLLFCSDIEEGKLFNDLDELSDVVTDLVRLQDVLSLQCTAWIAKVTNKKAIKNSKIKDKYIENLFEEIEENPQYKFYEFMGIDIDTGFRLTKQTRAGRLTLSFELAYLMAFHNNSVYIKNLNIISYRSLKGVWNNLSYPIIWYYNKSKHNNVSFSESIPFDAIEHDDIYSEYFGTKKFAKKMYFNVKNALKKICKDRKLKNKINNIVEVIERDTSFNKQYINTSRLELHCVAVCFNKHRGILCVQRAENGFLPFKWEFGCAKANYKENLKDTILKEYKNDFNIDISLAEDNSREDKQPIPLVVYTINKNSEIHKGIIFIANILNEENIMLNSKKHSKYQFIGKEDLESLSADDYVPDAIDTMRRAFKLYEEVFQGEG